MAKHGIEGFSIQTTSNFFICGISYAFFWWGLFALYCMAYQVNNIRKYLARKKRISGDNVKAVKPLFHFRCLSYMDMVVRIPFVTEMIAVKHIIGMFIFMVVDLLFIFFSPFEIMDGYEYVLSQINIFDRRAAVVGMVNWGFVFFLAQRNSVLPRMSGFSVEELLPFHRWIARIGLAEFIPHFVWRIWKGYTKHYVVADALFEDTEQTTGTISMLGFLLMFVTAFEYIRRNHFELFYYCHIIGMLIAIIFACWHETTCFAFFIPAIILWFMDRAIRSYQSWYIKSSYIKVDQVLPYSSTQEGIVRILFENSGLNRFKPGQYMFISIVRNGGRKLWEYANWHPITVSETIKINNNSATAASSIEERIVGTENVSGEKTNKEKNNVSSSIGSFSDIDSISDVSHLRRRAHNASNNPFTTTIGSFHIKALGGKTRDLLKASAAGESLAVRLDGPYGPHLQYQDYQIMALFAAGIGITPALSVIKDCIERRSDGVKSVGVKHIYLTWAVRASDEIQIFMDMFTYWSERAKSAIQPIQLHASVYVTRMNSGEDYFEHISGFNIIYGQRPQIAVEMDKIRTTNPHQSVWAHVCGSTLFTRTVVNEAIRHGFDAHNETFEF